MNRLVASKIVRSHRVKKVLVIASCCSVCNLCSTPSSICTWTMHILLQIKSLFQLKQSGFSEDQTCTELPGQSTPFHIGFRSIEENI